MMARNVWNDPYLSAEEAGISHHRRGIQQKFPDQGALTAHLMALEIFESDAVTTLEQQYGDRLQELPLQDCERHDLSTR